jgi:hypothetical protein
VTGQLPAHDPAAEGVDHEREEHQPLPAAQVGQVGDPEPIRPGGAEVAIDQIRATVGQRVWPGRAPRLAAALGALDAIVLHQPLDLAARRLLAGPQQRQPGAPIAVGLVVGLVDLADARKQPLVVDRAR